MNSADDDQIAEAIFHSVKQKDSLRPEILALMWLRGRYPIADAVLGKLLNLQNAATDERRRQLDLEIQKVGNERDAIKEEGILFSHDKYMVVFLQMMQTCML